MSFCGGVADLFACRYGLQAVTRCGQQQTLSENVFVIDGPSVCLFIHHSSKWSCHEKSESSCFLRYEFLTLGNVFQTFWNLCSFEKSGTIIQWHGAIHSFIHFFCLPNDRCLVISQQVLHTVRYNVSSFHLQYPLLSLRPFSTLLRLLPRLHVTYFPFIPSISQKNGMIKYAAVQSGNLLA